MLIRKLISVFESTLILSSPDHGSNSFPKTLFFTHLFQLPVPIFSLSLVFYLFHWEMTTFRTKISFSFPQTLSPYTFYFASPLPPKKSPLPTVTMATSGSLDHTRSFFRMPRPWTLSFFFFFFFSSSVKVRKPTTVNSVKMEYFVEV